LKDRGVTSIITAEAGDGSTLTRHGLEEYVADCVIFLDHRVNEQISTRRIRVVKYRGSTHGTNEYPFLLDHNGLAVLPITALGLNYKASSERVFTGVPGLDDMMGGLGFFRGSSVLVTGTAGTGKSSIASSFVDAACARGERALYFAFEESPDQILRNMRSLGIRLDKWIKQGLLKIIAVRPTTRGLENHLASICKDLDEFRPKVAAVDPITNLISIGTPTSVKAMLTRLVDILKGRQITALFTNLMVGDRAETNTEISSLMDTWIMVRDFEIEGSRRRLIYVLKSRGMEHSADVREFTISSRGVRVTPVDTRTVESNRKG
jgi:circadian clock protein KaiC